MKTWVSNASIPIERPISQEEADISKGTGSSVLSKRKRKTAGFGKIKEKVSKLK